MRALFLFTKPLADLIYKITALSLTLALVLWLRCELYEPVLPLGAPSNAHEDLDIIVLYVKIDLGDNVEAASTAAANESGGGVAGGVAAAAPAVPPISL